MPIITQTAIDPSTRVVEYTVAVASTGPFEVPFPMFEGVGDDLVVEVNGAVVARVGNWTFAGTPPEPSFPGAVNTWTDGEITFAVAISGTLKITGRRSPSRVTGRQFVEGRGIPAREHNSALNELTVVDQELRRDIDAAQVGVDAVLDLYGADSQFLGLGGEWLWDAGTADADPGAGKLRLNNANASSATQAFVDVADADGTDLTPILDTFDDSTSGVKGYVRLWAKSEPSRRILASVTALTSATGYRKLTLAGVAASGATPFTAGERLLLGFSPVGDRAVGVADVVGPASSVNNRVARFDGTTGKLLKDGGTDLALVQAIEGADEVTVAGASTTDIGAAASINVVVTGSTTITSFGTTPNIYRRVRFAADVTVIHHPTTLVLPEGVSAAVRAGEVWGLRFDSSGNCRRVSRSALVTPAHALDVGAFAGASSPPVTQGRLRVISDTTALHTSGLPAVDLDDSGRFLLASSPLSRRQYEVAAVPGGTTLVNNGLLTTQVGTATAVTPATTSTYTISAPVEFLVTVAATTAVASIRTNTVFARGPGGATITAGVLLRARWGFATGATVATKRAFCGLRGSLAAPTDVNPSSLTDIIGMGWDNGDSSVQIMHNDSSGAATKVNTGLALPSVDRTEFYDLHLYAPGGGGGVQWRVTRSVLDTASGVLDASTNMPAGTTFLGYQNYVSVGGTSSVVGLAHMGLYAETSW